MTIYYAYISTQGHNSSRLIVESVTKCRLCSYRGWVGLADDVQSAEAIAEYALEHAKNSLSHHPLMIKCLLYMLG